ncbi:plasma kallikrein-like isoform X3 [Sardina pilchardus]|uniref:plasma kallikrein-like isoform X3 n=1 Tax=Sardina pilchardus TaxID=27697 RepID=UPI002E12998F
MMRLCMIHLCLIPLLRYCFSEECVPNLRVDVDFPGSDVLQIFSPDELHCQRACSQHHSCQFFTFIRPDWTRDSRHFYCYLKHTNSGEPSEVTELEGVTSGYSLKNCNETTECFSDLRVDVDFPGSDVLQIFSPDELHCQRACSQHHSCQFFTFIRPDWTRDSRHFYCYLKHTDTGEPSRVNKLEGVTSGYSLKNCNETTGGLTRLPPHFRSDGCLSSVYEDVDFYGADYHSLFTADYKECQRACTSDPGCRFFSWLNDDFAIGLYKYKCHLKFSWSVSKPPALKILSGVVSGFSQKVFQINSRSDCQTEQCEARILTNTDFPAHDFEQIPAVSAEHCQFLCSAHPKCTFFTYQKQKVRCFLKNSKDQKPMQSKEDLYSGMPSRFCELPKDWATIRYEGLDFPGFDIRYVKLDDPNSCEALCTADPHCQFYTYVYTSFYEPDFRRRCYLKRVITMPVPPKVASLKGVMSGFSLRGCHNPNKTEEATAAVEKALGCEI